LTPPPVHDHPVSAVPHPVLSGRSLPGCQSGPGSGPSAQGMDVCQQQHPGQPAAATGLLWLPG